MKSMQEIINQEAVYMNDWTDKFGLISDFDEIHMTKEEYEATETPYRNVEVWEARKERMKKAIQKWEDINILFASYGYANYSGDAWVLYEQNGRLWEVNGSHCSCYGLEGQWAPEIVSLAELENRLMKGTWGEDNWSDNNFKERLCNFLGIEYKSNQNGV
ncbi:hypothetical protein [Paenibacillus silvisoli]|uniref:hypothetical protein n=1 Tax=Paenibacillus silvisoli TaxID=3110539 RepID=UPI00280485D1|nr:hypothetical protein [Paenibacillus silvisoli]